MTRKPAAMAGLCLGAGVFLFLGAVYDLISFYFAAVALMTLWALAASTDAANRERRPELVRWAGPAFLVAVCFFMEPALSDDHHRYLWEGYVQNQGYSPYIHSPRSLYDELDHPSEGRINHDALTAIYPPLAQYLFRLSAWIGPSVYVWKALILLSLAAALLLARGRFGAVLVVGPMVLVEGVWHGHVDVLGLLPGFWLMLAIGKGRAGSAGCALAAMVGLKLIPILFFPLVFFHFPSKWRLRFVGVFVLVLTLIYLPYLAQIEYLFQSFLRFSQDWHFNNPLYKALRYVLPNQPTRLLLTLLFLGSYIWLLLARGGIAWKCLAAWTLVTLFSPTVFPWYLLWLSPFVQPGRDRYLHGLYAAAFLSYLVWVPFRATGVWQDRWWWMIPEWAGMLFCFWRMLGNSGFRFWSEPAELPSTKTLPEPG